MRFGSGRLSPGELKPWQGRPCLRVGGDLATSDSAAGTRVFWLQGGWLLGEGAAGQTVLQRVVIKKQVTGSTGVCLPLPYDFPRISIDVSNENVVFFLLKNIICLHWVLVVAHRVFHCSIQTLNCGM